MPELPKEQAQVLPQRAAEIDLPVGRIANPSDTEVRTDQRSVHGKFSSAARTNDVSPEVAAELAQVASRMRQLVYGDGAIPEWGTKFTEIESQGSNVGRNKNSDSVWAARNGRF